MSRNLVNVSIEKLENLPFKILDVGVDTHPEFRPYNYEEVEKIMKDRTDLKIDHHGNRE